MSNMRKAAQEPCYVKLLWVRERDSVVKDVSVQLQNTLFNIIRQIRNHKIQADLLHLSHHNIVPAVGHS